MSLVVGPRRACARRISSSSTRLRLRGRRAVDRRTLGRSGPRTAAEPFVVSSLSRRRGPARLMSEEAFPMAIRKIGSRRIVVDGVPYRWRVRHRATYSQMDYGHGTLDLAIE